jgi:hypothetical protein
MMNDNLTRMFLIYIILSIRQNAWLKLTSNIFLGRQTEWSVNLLEYRHEANGGIHYRRKKQNTESAGKSFALKE